MITGFIGGKYLPFHIGHLNTIIEASNQCDKLYVILSYSENRDRNYCKNTNIKYMPHLTRLSWIRKATSDMENVTVIAIEDNAPNDDEYNWEEGAQKIKEEIKENIDLIFSSEESYGPIFNKLYPNSKHILIDPKRSFCNISGTQIRKEGPFKNWDKLPKEIRPFFVKKVMIVGTESCGKSTLVRNLAKIFNTNYVHEYGREICEEIGGADVLTPEHFREIAYKQKVLEYNQLETSNKVLFIDTEVIITKYYYDLYIQEKDNGLFDKIAHYQNYDLWIFLEPDVKWVNDGTRTFGEQKIRENNNKILKQMLEERNINYITISGNYQERFLKARNLVENLIN